MPFDRSKYPEDWEAVSKQIRTERSGGRCECTGECGLHSTNPGPRRCTERNGDKAKWAKGNVVLTVAHLDAKDGVCKCDPLCSNPEHLKAMCQRCHLRYDHPRHVANARRTRFERKACGELFEDDSREDMRR